MTAPLRIALCGGLAVEREGERLEPNLAGRQGREVFTYLVLNRSRPVSRGEVTAMLWPEQAPRAPEAALNTILARLRRVLGSEALGARGQLTLSLPSESWIDVEFAEEAANRAQGMLNGGDPVGARGVATAALDTIAAPLLPELEHTWIDQWRTEVDDLHTRLLILGVRARLSLGGGHLQDAERLARRLIEREPFRESGYALLMEAQAARGDVAEALMTYEQVRTLLRDELGIPPSTTLMALHQRLLGEQSQQAADPSTRPAGAAAEPTPPAPPPLPDRLARAAATPMAGRRSELAAMLAPWSGAAPGKASLTVVAGEPGIGKSTLVATLAREVQSRGAVVLAGRSEAEPIVPYSPLVEALRHYLAHTPQLAADTSMAAHLAELRWLIPELSDLPAPSVSPSGDPRVARLRLYRAAAAVLAHAAAHHDVLLLLEDLQWADGDTLLVARQLLREEPPHPVHAVFTYRADEVDDEHPLARTLAELRRDVDVTRVTLTGLDEAGIRELLQTHNGHRSAATEDSSSRLELVRRLRAHTAGNPFFIGEVVRSLDELGTGIEDPSRAAGELLTLPEGVLAVIQERLRRLPAATRDALAAAAVLGDGVSLEMLRAVLGEGWSATAVDPAVHGGLLVPDPTGGRYRFCHALAREAIYRSTGPGRRSDLHLTAARALEERRQALGVEPAEIARHLAASNRSDTTPEAIAYLREASERALASHAYGSAGKHLQFALSLLERDRPQDSATRCELLLDFGEVSWQAADPNARAVYQQALSVAHSLGGERLAEAALGLGGRFYAPVAPDVPYVELLKQTAESIDGGDRTLQTRMDGRLAEHLMMLDPARAPEIGRRALAQARALGDRSLLVATLLSTHASLLSTRHLAERRRLADEQVALARKSGEPEMEALGLHWLLFDLLEAGELAAAAQAVPRLRTLADELRQPLYRHSALVWTRVLDQVAGRFEVAEQLSHEALNLSQNAQGNAAKIHFVAQRMSVVRDVGGAERLLETSRRWPHEGSLLWLTARWVLELECGELADEDPERDQAVRDLADYPRDVYSLPVMAWLAEVVAAAGDGEQAETMYELLLPYADCWTQLMFDGSFGSVRRQLGLLAGRLGRGEVASELLDGAVRAHAGAGTPALEARARLDWGEAILEGRAAGSPEQAKELLTGALALAREVEAERLAARVERCMCEVATG